MKSNRQEKILQIIEDKIIFTQDDLQNELNKLGFNVTQSTVSRDIKELHLIKGRDENGNYRYISHNIGQSEHTAKQYNDIISRYVLSADYAQNDVVIKCYSGMASSVAVALDSLYSDKMLGSIAGDDTIFIISRTENDAKLLSNEIKKIL